MKPLYLLDNARRLHRTDDGESPVCMPSMVKWRTFVGIGSGSTDSAFRAAVDLYSDAKWCEQCRGAKP